MTCYWWAESAIEKSTGTCDDPMVITNALSLKETSEDHDCGNWKERLNWMTDKSRG